MTRRRAVPAASVRHHIEAVLIAMPTDWSSEQAVAGFRDPRRVTRTRAGSLRPADPAGPARAAKRHGEPGSAQHRRSRRAVLIDAVTAGTAAGHPANADRSASLTATRFKSAASQPDLRADSQPPTDASQRCHTDAAPPSSARCRARYGRQASRRDWPLPRPPSSA